MNSVLRRRRACSTILTAFIKARDVAWVEEVFLDEAPLFPECLLISVGAIAILIMHEQA